MIPAAALSEVMITAFHVFFIIHDLIFAEFELFNQSQTCVLCT